MKLLTALFGTMLLVALAAPPGTLAAPPSTQAAAVDAQGAPDFELPAVQLRIVLGRALGEHAFLVIEAMRTSAQAGPETDAAAAALEENTAEIEALVASVLSEGEAAAFGDQWRNHVAYLVDYARAVSGGDEDAAELAESQLATYADEFSSLLLEAFPSLPSHAVEELVGEHVAQLEQVTDLAGGDYESAYSAIRDTYAHMFAIADGLTVGITARADNALEGRETALSRAVDLRMTLDRLFGEHTYLAAIVMRGRVKEAPYLDAAIASLARNSLELAEQVSTIYGADAGAAFEALWSRHTTLYVEYVDATTTDDEESQQAALSGLATYRSDFSAFLADANPLIDAAALERLLEAHTGHLVEQVGAYAGADYGRAYGMLREAYAQTEELSSGLAGAIADQFPQLFPDTAVPPTLPHPDIETWPSVFGFVLVAWATGLAVHRARAHDARFLWRRRGGAIS